MYCLLRFALIEDLRRLKRADFLSHSSQNKEGQNKFLWTWQGIHKPARALYGVISPKRLNIDELPIVNYVK